MGQDGGGAGRGWASRVEIEMRVGPRRAPVLLIVGASCKAAWLVLHPLGDLGRVQGQSWKKANLSGEKL